MPKNATYPTLYDTALTIDMARLKQWGYLKPQQIFQAKMNWERDGETIASISAKINTLEPDNYIELNYSSSGEPRKYKVHMVSIPSNLGKGEIPYFVCPQTGKRCRKLYLISGYFFHRDAFNYCMYESQTKSKYWRRVNKEINMMFKPERLRDEMHSSHFKTHYNGKPTKRYRRILKEIQQAESIPLSSFTSLR